MKRFFQRLASKFSPQGAPPRPGVAQTGAHRAPPSSANELEATPSRADYIELDAHLEDETRDDGADKKVLVRTRYIREDTGTHETLKILDDSIIDSEEETGIDPYNTGRFDRSKNWDKRFRK